MELAAVVCVAGQTQLRMFKPEIVRLSLLTSMLMKQLISQKSIST
jgi:hypothetical protein